MSPRHFDLRTLLLSLLANALYLARFLITILDHDLSTWSVLTLSRLRTPGQDLTQLDRLRIRRDCWSVPHREVEQARSRVQALFRGMASSPHQPEATVPPMLPGGGRRRIVSRAA